jgi:hypothetical protein
MCLQLIFNITPDNIKFSLITNFNYTTKQDEFFVFFFIFFFLFFDTYLHRRLIYMVFIKVAW